MATTIINVQKVPKALLEPHRGKDDVAPRGVTLSPKKNGNFLVIDVYVREKMSQYETRVTLAHELFHCLQYLTGCQMEERNSNEIDEIMVKALKDKPKGRKKT